MKISAASGNAMKPALRGRAPNCEGSCVRRSSKQCRLTPAPPRRAQTHIRSKVSLFVEAFLGFLAWILAIAVNAKNETKAEFSNVPLSRSELRPAMQTFVAQRRTKPLHTVFATMRTFPTGSPG